ncbi:MAG: hypothetical protein MMC33_006963 [Icmadophila ericetorum]|nr:hypothetical protein [Icmadophila ericetorum]
MFKTLLYSFTNIKQAEFIVDARIDSWINKLDELFATKGEPFDFAFWASYLTFDILSDIGFGEPFGFVETASDVGGLIANLRDGFLSFGILARLYPLTGWIKKTWLGQILIAGPEDETGIGALMRFRDEFIDRRIDEIESGTVKSRADILQAILEARTDKGKPLDLACIKAEALLIMMAGADTTASAISSLFHNILTSPTVRAKITAEIDHASAAGKLSAIPQYDEVLKHCPYYVVCIHETLRLWPSAPGIFPRLVPKGGMTLDGKFVPEGIEVTCHAWAVNRDPGIYGPDVEEFVPERWLNHSDEDAARKFHKYNFTFGYGTRACLGKDLAYMELCKGSLQFLRRFEFRLVDEDKLGTFSVKGGGLGIWNDVWMNVERRKGA